MALLPSERVEPTFVPAAGGEVAGWLHPRTVGDRQGGSDSLVEGYGRRLPIDDAAAVDSEITYWLRLARPWMLAVPPRR